MDVGELKEDFPRSIRTDVRIGFLVYLKRRGARVSVAFSRRFLTRSNSALLIGSRYKLAGMWVSTMGRVNKRTKRMKGRVRREDGHDKFTDRKGRGLLLFVGMLRGISPWNSIGSSKWHRACRYYSHDPSFLPCLPIDRVSFLLLSFLLLFLTQRERERERERESIHFLLGLVSRYV